jgi:putative hydrolase of the HAD superfamily
MEFRDHIRGALSPLVPQPTGVEPKIVPLDGIRAVVFDIYGTLLISDAGEICSGTESRRIAAMGQVIDDTGLDLKVKALLRCYDDQIERALQSGREEGIDFPEVEIREVWRKIFLQQPVDPISDERLEEIAIAYECISNPVWPMPGARCVIERLRSAGLTLGIVSNAQFYTPLVMESLFETALSDLGFSEDWTVYSFRTGQGKPSPAIYEEMKMRAGNAGVLPEEILYVGNDMIKDVEPAAAVGFNTCLFAGDARSLRLGNGWIDDAKNIADVIVTSLDQIPDLFEVK